MKITAYLWRRNVNRPLQLTNLNHAALLVQPTYRVAETGLRWMIYFTTDPIRNPFPRYVLPANGQVDAAALSGNVWAGVPSLNSQNINTLRNIFGMPWRQRELFISNEKGEPLRQILQNNTAGSPFMNFRQRFHHSIPVCLYLCSRATGFAHSRSVNVVNSLKQRAIERAPINDGAEMQPLAIETDYLSNDLDRKLLALGFK